MLGSTAFPWFVNGPVSLRTEDCLLYLFSVTGIVLSLVAYDYQVWTLNHLYFSSLFTWSLAFQFAILCAGDWSSSGTILFISCLHWPYFTFTCQIENFVISLSLSLPCFICLLWEGLLTYLWLIISNRYVPNELRGGMISLSLAPANLALVFFLMQVCVYLILLTCKLLVT